MNDPELDKFMQEMAKINEEIVKLLWPERNLVFAVLVADIGADGHVAYVSNAQRGDMIKLLRECADSLEDHSAPYSETH